MRRLVSTALLWTICFTAALGCSKESVAHSDIRIPKGRIPSATPQQHKFKIPKPGLANGGGQS
jgi:hypothetical protein